jgi:hypothetical protein
MPGSMQLGFEGSAIMPTMAGFVSPYGHRYKIPGNSVDTDAKNSASSLDRMQDYW